MPNMYPTEYCAWCEFQHERMLRRARLVLGMTHGIRSLEGMTREDARAIFRKWVPNAEAEIARLEASVIAAQLNPEAYKKRYGLP